GKHFMIQAANYRALDKSAQQYPLFVYGFATNPAMGIGKYSPPSCRGGSIPMEPPITQGGQGIERFIDQLGALQGVEAKMLIFSSAATAEYYLKREDFKNKLRQAGIEWLGYNMEGD